MRAAVGGYDDVFSSSDMIAINSFNSDAEILSMHDITKAVIGRSAAKVHQTSAGGASLLTLNPTALTA